MILPSVCFLPSLSLGASGVGATLRAVGTPPNTLTDSPAVSELAASDFLGDRDSYNNSFVVPSPAFELVSVASVRAFSAARVRTAVSAVSAPLWLPLRSRACLAYW